MTERHCYCNPGDDSCGTCQDCGAPGHTRAHPTAPYTGAWCDACYEKVGGASVSLGTIVTWLLLAGMIAIAGFMIWRLIK